MGDHLGDIQQAPPLVGLPPGLPVNGQPGVVVAFAGVFDRVIGVPLPLAPPQFTPGDVRLALGLVPADPLTGLSPRD